jgi:hypothetical protein
MGYWLFRLPGWRYNSHTADNSSYSCFAEGDTPSLIKVIISVIRSFIIRPDFFFGENNHHPAQIFLLLAPQLTSLIGHNYCLILIFRITR